MNPPKRAGRKIALGPLAFRATTTARIAMKAINAYPAHLTAGNSARRCPAENVALRRTSGGRARCKACTKVLYSAFRPASVFPKAVPENTRTRSNRRNVISHTPVADA